jgi:hypothetical protein
MGETQKPKEVGLVSKKLPTLGKSTSPKNKIKNYYKTLSNVLNHRPQQILFNYHEVVLNIP